MLYLITDTHLGHQNMLKSCSRPARFTNLIFDNCRKMVKSEGTLIHLGDVAWNAEELMRFMKLLGRKILVRGNHDKKSTAYYMDAGFALVVDSVTMTLQGIRILFLHAPLYGHTADINIHGHQHDLHFEDVSRQSSPKSPSTTMKSSRVSCFCSGKDLLLSLSMSMGIWVSPVR